LKQTLLTRSGLIKSSGTAVAVLMLAFNATAQSAPADTLQTGYGKRPLDQLTENVRVLHAPQLNQGIIYSPEALLNGQIAGLRVQPSNGTLGASSQMVLRLGSSILGSNSPLVVLDGVPLENNSVSEFTSALSFLSPHDIESVTLLKDAAAIAVYGGRATDGVLYITTKKGSSSSKIKVDFTSRAGISMIGKKADILSAGEFRTLINQELPEESHLLGNSDTDWQNVIYRKAFSHDQHIGLSGTVLNTVPYRISFGHINQNGILKTAQARRNSLALSLQPSFLQGHLRLDLHVRTANEKLRVADKFNITTALAFDPTQPVYDETGNGGYFTYRNSDGTPNTYAVRNPLAVLEQRHDGDNSGTLYGHARLQYSLHFLPSLSVNARYARMDQNNQFTSARPAYLGPNASYEKVFDNSDRKINWELKEAYLAYDQSLEQLKGRIRLVTGALRREEYFEHNLHPSLNEKGQPISGYDYRKATAQSESLYGQFSFLLKDRYLFEASVANDRNSTWSVNTSQLSYAAGVSWNLLNEGFMSHMPFLSDLRIFANHSQLKLSETNSLSFMGGYYQGFSLSPALNARSTDKWNTGFSWGVANNKITGDLNFYRIDVSDLPLILKVSPALGGTRLVVNSQGYMTRGIEKNLRYQVVSNPDWSWSVGANMAFMKSEVKDLMPDLTFYLYNDILHLKEGLPINTFYLFEQLYDGAGKPIDRGYKLDASGNRERQPFQSVDPSYLFGFQSEISYKRLSGNFLLRGSAGNHVYNAVNASRGSLYYAYGFNFLENIASIYHETGFKMHQLSSNHYLENASFLRMEYLQLTYDLGNVFKENATLKLNATAQNAFVITKYKGQDPEVRGGIDRGQHPQPRTFSVGLNLSI
jgi:TonB-dependent starch-binding outer membrane protein SusC